MVIIKINKKLYLDEISIEEALHNAQKEKESQEIILGLIALKYWAWQDWHVIAINKKMMRESLKEDLPELIPAIKYAEKNCQTSEWTKDFLKEHDIEKYLAQKARGAANRNI